MHIARTLSIPAVFPLMVCSSFSLRYTKRSLHTFSRRRSIRFFSATTTGSSPTEDEHNIQNDTTTPNSHITRKRKVAVIGAGAMGSYYGARLWEAGHDVEFHMRSNIHYRAARQAGLCVTSIDGNVHIPAEVLRVYQDTHAMQPADWVVVALKSTALPEIPALIAPVLSTQSRLLVIMNGFVEDDLIAALQKHYGDDISSGNDSRNGRRRISCCQNMYGGMAFICCNRLAPAATHHSFYGPLSAGVAAGVSSSSEPATAQAEQEFLNLFAETKVQASFVPSLLRERWRKNIWNLPFNGISVAMGGSLTVDQIVGDPGLRSLAQNIMAETIAIGNADLQEQQSLCGDNGLEPLTQTDADFMMSLSDSMGPYQPSTMIDLVERRPMEVQYMFRKPLDRARELGVDAPCLETIVQQAEAYQRLHGLY